MNWITGMKNENTLLPPLLLLLLYRYILLYLLLYSQYMCQKYSGLNIIQLDGGGCGELLHDHEGASGGVVVGTESR